MGYYTNFNFYLFDFETKKPIDKSLKNKILEKLSDRYYLDIDFQNDCCNEKWYSHINDMCEFSKEYPDILFKIYGEGQDRDDMWYDYYYNGKHYICYATITYEEPDYEKLK